MESIIKKLTESQKICSIYTNSQLTDSFSVGYMLQYDKNHFLFESIDQYGKADGLFCTLVDNIIRIENESEYLLCINKLFLYSKQERHPQIIIKNGVLESMIDYSIENQKVCSIELCNSGTDDVIGFIKKRYKDSLDIEIIDLYGKRDGKQTINLCDISHIGCDSNDEKKIEILFKINN